MQITADEKPVPNLVLLNKFIGLDMRSVKDR